MCKGFLPWFHHSMFLLRSDKQLGKQMFSIESSTLNPCPLSVLFCIWHNRKGNCASLHHWVYSNAQPGCVVDDRWNFVPLCDVLWTKLLLNMVHNISVTFHPLSTLSFISFHLKCVIYQWFSTVFSSGPRY